MCAVDLGKYIGSSNCLRLPLARKFAGTARLLPADGTLAFEKCQVNLVEVEEGMELLCVGGTDPSPRRAIGEGGEMDEKVVERLLHWVALRAPQGAPSGLEAGGCTFKCFVRGLVCPVKRAPHRSNGTRINVFLGHAGVVTTFMCMDPDCDHATTDCDDECVYSTCTSLTLQ